ncbi:MAG: PEP-CTERM sorting domain-containing protein [Planctomycetes bacterium]|nr:PEP-CTERM sorting domain-containing protein [Planctomycetota bacterium]
MSRTLAVLGAFLSIAVGNGFADLTIRITASDSYGNVGGEYNVTHQDLGYTPIGLTGSNPVETFCLEKNESLAFGYQYYAFLNTEAVQGGIGGGSPDPLSPQSAYLYSEFITGQLAGYHYDTSDGGTLRSRAADDLQAVIWFLEDEEAMSWTPGDGSRREQFHLDALANAGSGIGDVRVLNLYIDAQGAQLAQDLLIKIPEPASLGLLLVGALGLRRRGR